MENIGYAEETIKEPKPLEMDTCKVPVSCCTNHSGKGLETCCKSGAFLIPLCIVI